MEFASEVGCARAMWFRLQENKVDTDCPKKRQQYPTLINSPYSPSLKSILDQAQKLLSLKLEGTVG
jgi:hypothetical protein